MSGLIARPNSFPGVILGAMLAGDLTLLLSPILLSEYDHAARRPRIQQAHGHTPRELERIWQRIAVGAAVVDVRNPQVPAPDPKDDHVWALLEYAPEAILVTGDRLLLESDHFPRRVLTPRDFVERHLDPSE